MWLLGKSARKNATDACGFLGGSGNDLAYLFLEHFSLFLTNDVNCLSKEDLVLGDNLGNETSDIPNLLWAKYLHCRGPEE